MKKTVFVAALALLALPSARAELVANGSFEQPVVLDNCCNLYGTGNPFPGWTVTTGNVEVINGEFVAGNNISYAANQYLDLVGVSGVGGISQSFATTAGQSYSLSFAYSHNSFRGPSLNSATFSVGTLSGTVVHDTGSLRNLDWRLFSDAFTATSSVSTLTFTSLQSTLDGGIFLDAISVGPIAAPVPEPETWALLAAGLLTLGGASKFRRRAAGSALPR